ncbi:MAG: 3-oxoacyl-[acyl-carrier-protein] reductase [Chloroflexi bacterium]|nr:3-oxoacyl-[acyl-carrier-protein] reductase [Chloroflexota bacterium]MCH7837028.1 3-oxoacyl-[acyl-carrier-protein] reductase [Chloroflexota bacterium]
MFDLNEKVALVTGGSRGIGRAIALALAERGARVAVNYVANAEAAAAVVEEIAGAGGQAIAIQGDVSQAEDAKRLVNETLAQFDGLHILVNNAGLTKDDLLLRMSEEAWDRVMEVDLRGAFLCTKAAIRPLIRQRWGRIINIASVAGMVGNAGQANYAAAKAGLIGFTKAIAKEVASRKVTANAIAPGLVRTEMTADLTEAQETAVLQLVPLGRMATPEEIAPAVVFLASEEAAYITGHVLAIDGGLVMH